jgi:hypothetical protein
MDDIDFHDGCYCPKCGNECRSRDCGNMFCDEGYVDEYEDDPLWFDPGDESECGECHGTGIERWCSECGWQWHGENLVTDSEMA